MAVSILSFARRYPCAAASAVYLVSFGFIYARNRIGFEDGSSREFGALNIQSVLAEVVPKGRFELQ
jgi:hypothetical protein